MTTSNIDPSKIDKPLQMLALLVVCLISLVGVFLTAGASISEPTWIKDILYITAILLVPTFLRIIFLMWTKYRPQLQDDPHFAKWCERQDEMFRDFKAENTESKKPPANFPTRIRTHDSLSFITTSSSTENGDTTKTLAQEKLRVGRYEENQGIFLIHHWRPSVADGQIVDIVIEPTQHQTGPLSNHLVESITYFLGPMFFDGNPVTKRNVCDNFRLHISAYGPLLCLAEVQIKNQDNPLILERYIDFDDALTTK